MSLWKSSLAALTYKGTWNAATNSPALASGVGVRADYYIVSFSGATNLDGITDWVAGDWLVFNGTAWQKLDQTDLVQSVNGKTGVVALVYSSAASNPTVNNDGVDTAVLGRTFIPGDMWINIATGVLYVCMTNGTGAALWVNYLEKRAGDLNTLTEKLSVANADVFVMNDSADGYKVKKIQSVNMIPCTKGKILFDSWAGGFYIPATAGASHQVVVGVNRDAEVHVFDDASEMMVGFGFYAPADLDDTETLYFDIFASPKITETKKCAWKLYASPAKTDGTESWDQLFGSYLIDDQALPTTAKFMKKFTISGPAGVGAGNFDIHAGDWIRFRLSSPLSATVGDRRTDDLYLHGLIVRRA